MVSLFLVVVLPDPFGPDTAKISPPATEMASEVYDNTTVEPRVSDWFSTTTVNSSPLQLPNDQGHRVAVRNL